MPQSLQQMEHPDKKKYNEDRVELSNTTDKMDLKTIEHSFLQQIIHSSPQPWNVLPNRSYLRPQSKS
jgi:hypothetical protein